MTESILLDIRENYLQGNRGVIPAAWNGIKSATRINRIFDPSGTLDRSDFELVGMLGVVQAFDGFDSSFGMMLRTWTIKICDQKLIAELKAFVRPSFVPVSKLHLNDSEYTSEEILSYLAPYCLFEPSFIAKEYYEAILKELLNRLYNYNRRIYQFLKFRVDNPELDSSAVMNILGISTVYCSYNKVINQFAREIVQKYESCNKFR